MRSKVLACLSAVAAVAALAPMSAALADTAAPGIQIRAAHSNKCLNVSGNSTANSAKIIQYTCSPTAANDKFQLVQQPDNTYLIKGVGSGKCLNVQGGGTADSTPIIQYTCSTAANTLWRVNAVPGKPTIRLIGVQSGKCLNVPNASVDNSVQLVQYTCTTTGAANEQFYLPPATSAAPVPVSSPVYPGVSAVQTTTPVSNQAPVTLTYTDRDGATHISTFFNLQNNHPNPTPDISYSFTGMAGLPKVALLGSGRFRVLAHDAASGDFQSIDEQTPGTGKVYGPVDIGGAMTADPVLGPISPGHLGAYAIIGGALWFSPDRTDGQIPATGAWRSLGGTGLVGLPTVIATATGARVVALTSAGTMVTATLDDDTLSAWTDLGGTGLAGTPAAVADAGNAVQVFARTTAGTVVTKRQDVNGNFPAAWTSIAQPNYKVIGSPSVTLEKAQNHIVLLVRDEANIPYMSYLDAAGGFTGWTKIADATSEYGASLSDPVVFSYVDKYAGGTKGYAVLYQDLTYLQIRFYNAPTTAAAAKSLKPAAATALPKV
jgi:hypothetical protein